MKTGDLLIMLAAVAVAFMFFRRKAGAGGLWDLLSPSQGAAVLAGDTVLFSWAGPALGQGEQYVLQAARDSGFANMVLNLGGPGTEVPYSFTDTGAYYWRVLRLNASQAIVDSSPVGQFTVQ